MKKYFSTIRVRYGETDQMGVVHHGNYAQYLEIARIDWLSQFGVSYGKMEEEGIMMPVRELNIRFRRPARFDDLLTVETSLRKIPDMRIIFDYRIYNEEKNMLTTASSELVFLDSKTWKPIHCPEYILEKLK